MQIGLEFVDCLAKYISKRTNTTYTFNEFSAKIQLCLLSKAFLKQKMIYETNSLSPALHPLRVSTGTPNNFQSTSCISRAFGEIRFGSKNTRGHSCFVREFSQHNTDCVNIFYYNSSSSYNVGNIDKYPSKTYKILPNEQSRPYLWYNERLVWSNFLLHQIINFSLGYFPGFWLYLKNRIFLFHKNDFLRVSPLFRTLVLQLKIIHTSSRDLKRGLNFSKDLIFYRHTN